MSTLSLSHTHTQTRTHTHPHTHTHTHIHIHTHTHTHTHFLLVIQYEAGLCLRHCGPKSALTGQPPLAPSHPGGPTRVCVCVCVCVLLHQPVQPPQFAHTYQSCVCLMCLPSVCSVTVSSPLFSFFCLFTSVCVCVCVCVSLIFIC